MQCLDCGFELDDANESQTVCPCCGADPNEHPGLRRDPELLSQDITADEIRNSTRPISAITLGNNMVN
jgi:hypothetical protein